MFCLVQLRKALLGLKCLVDLKIQHITCPSRSRIPHPRHSRCGNEPLLFLYINTNMAIQIDCTQELCRLSIIILHAIIHTLCVHIQIQTVILMHIINVH